MTDEEPGLEPTESAGRESAGAMLRHLRGSAGVHLAVLASMMKVAPQKLEALERDQWDQLPDVTFARGLAASVCRALGADPAPVLKRMPRRESGLVEPMGAGAGVAFHRPGDAPAPLLSSGVSRAVVAVVALLVLGAALLWFWPTLPIKLGAAGSQQGTVTAEIPSTPVASAPIAVAQGAVERAAPATASKPEPLPVADPAPPAVEPPAEHARAPAVAEQPVPNEVTTAVAGSAAERADVPAVAAVAEPAEEPEPPPADELAIQATGDSWVTVRDAQGQALLNRTLTAGERVSLDGELPLSVVIGRKDAVSVLIRGEPFDHRSLSSSTVARFQVK